MEIRELKIGELPFKEAKIYPEFNVKDSFIKKSPSLNNYICRLESYVKVNRNGCDYLVLCMRQEDIMTKESESSKIDSSGFLSEFKRECESVIKHYLIPEEPEKIACEFGEIVNYKYTK